MSQRTDRLKGYLRRLLEDRASKLWELLPQHQGVIQRLLDVLTDDAYLHARPPLAPTQYVLALPPEQADLLRQNNHVLDALAMAIHRAGRDVGLRFSVLPRVLLDSHPDLPPQGFRLDAVLWEPPHLQAVPIDPEINILPPSAYVIINGTQVFSLEKPVLHIGRRPDNDLLLDDPRVSRLHAQMRANRGRFMLFDLDSTGGTFVNNQRIRATMLYPGDVILMAGISLVYGQRSTRPLESPPSPPTVTDTGNLITTKTLRRPLGDGRHDT